MSGITNLQRLLKSLKPELAPGEFVFCTLPGNLHEYAHLNPLASFLEQEGLTLVLPLQTAQQQTFPYSGIFRKITLSVHSSLNAVGLTAAVSTRLASQGISANVIAAYYHDHIFIPEQCAEQALAALHTLSEI